MSAQDNDFLTQLYSTWKRYESSAPFERWVALTNVWIERLQPHLREIPRRYTPFRIIQAINNYPWDLKINTHDVTVKGLELLSLKSGKLQLHWFSMYELIVIDDDELSTTPEFVAPDQLEKCGIWGLTDNLDLPWLNLVFRFNGDLKLDETLYLITVEARQKSSTEFLETFFNNPNYDDFYLFGELSLLLKNWNDRRRALAEESWRLYQDTTALHSILSTSNP